MAITLTVTPNGQITLRKEVREHLGARQGDKVDVDLLPDGQVLLRAKPRKPISSVFGMLAAPDTDPDRVGVVVTCTGQVAGAPAAAAAGARRWRPRVRERRIGAARVVPGGWRTGRAVRCGRAGTGRSGRRGGGVASTAVAR